MAHLEGETSNLLFDSLEDWEKFLQRYAPYFKKEQLVRPKTPRNSS